MNQLSLSEKESLNVHWHLRKLLRLSSAKVKTRLLLLREPGQLQSADRHRIFPQLRQNDRWRGFENFHDETIEDGLHRCSQRLAETRQAAAQNNDLRVEQMNRMRKSESQIFGNFSKDIPCGFIPLVPGGAQMPGLSTNGIANESCQNACRLFCPARADARIDGHTGAARFQCRSVAIEPHMPDLGFARHGSMIDFLVHDEPSSDPAT